MSSVFCVPPLLFVTFHEMYGISFTLLGTLVLVNFVTQLGIDIIFSLFSSKFNIEKTVRAMPLITTAGLFTYAAVPFIFPDYAFAGLLVGTVIFSVAAGLSEALLSPTIAAMPSDNPQRDMSFLHSLYAFGVVTMVLFSTLFLRIFGNDKWSFLVGLLALLPIIPAALFMTSPMPDMNVSGDKKAVKRSGKRAIGILLCMACIFFGSGAENAMSNWISGYTEVALGVDKTVGDVLGTMMFAALLGIARISYARFGKNICRVLLVGMAGSVVCYLAAGLSSNVTIAFVACIIMGFATSMLWPGTLIMMEEKIPDAGVTAFALMAAGGDLGASVSPQLLGIIVDKVSVSSFGVRLAENLGIAPEQAGLKVGMIVCTLFPIAGFITVLFIIRFFKKNRLGENV